MTWQAFISEDQVHATQFRSTHAPPSLIKSVAAQPAVDDPLKPRFLELTCTFASVERFVQLVVDAVIPPELFGSAHNRRAFDACASHVVAPADQQS